MSVRTAAQRLTPATVVQYLNSRTTLADALAGRGARQVVLLRAEAAWDNGDELLLDERRRVRVAVAPSPLAVHELILEHLSARTEPRLLVVLTDREEAELDPALLVRVHRREIQPVDRWEVVGAAFGASNVDVRLRKETWAGEALLDAAGSRGWDRIGGTLAREHALAALAMRRLRCDSASGRIDPPTLLHWSAQPGGPELLRTLRERERIGLTAFLAEDDQAGPVGRAVPALTQAGHGPDALAFGLVCAALWTHASPQPDVYRARGRAERWFGDPAPADGQAIDQLITAFGRACEEFVTDLRGRAEHAIDPEAGRADRRIAESALARAGSLIRQFGADSGAAASPLLPAGLEHRFGVVGMALTAGEVGAVTQAVADLEAHRLASEPDQRVRVERVRMAQRLLRWLASAPDPAVATVATALDRHIAETAWVDRALDYLEAGGDTDPQLRSAYHRIGGDVRALRREFDRHFARRLATWTATGTDPGAMITVETFLPRVVKPLVAHHRVLILLLDGLSVAITTELAEELRRHWNEYDPIGDSGNPRRRPMAAALPSWTTVSRTSLFAGQLMTGTQADEKRLYPAHSFWGKAGAEIFHKNDLRADTGDAFGKELLDALAHPIKHVAVALNTIDDRLGKEQKLGDPEWQNREIGDLRALLRIAAGQGMAVLITSDHGHVIDRHGAKVDVIEPISSRHRQPGEPLTDAEIALSGPRMVAPEPGGSIVALWDADSHYFAQKAGYHGGAALAEVTIPILALLPFGVTPPKGWLELGDQRPTWWTVDQVAASVAMAPRQTRAAKTKAARTTPQTDALFTLDAAETATTRTDPRDVLLTRLFESSLFQAQLDLQPRKPASKKLEPALRALLDGPLSITAIAQRVGDPPQRAPGFAAVLRQLLNYDGVEVLETLDERTLRLNTALLREQFGL